MTDPTTLVLAVLTFGCFAVAGLMAALTLMAVIADRAGWLR